MIVSIIHEHEARRRSYELIAGEFGLSDSRVGSAVLSGAR